MRISQLAERVGLRPSTLRFYEQAGLLPTRRSASGYRQFDDDAVRRVEFITSGKRLGLPLDEIRDLLLVWQDGACSDVRQRLRPLVQARIVDAGLRAAELDAFTERLHDALRAIDGPALPGPCGPGCGIVPGEQADVPIACTLTGGEQADRIAGWRRLLGQAVHRERFEHGLRFELPAALAGQVAELAAAEQQCCPFFEFTISLSAGRLWLAVRAPRQAAALLTEVFGEA